MLTGIIIGIAIMATIKAVKNKIRCIAINKAIRETQ